MYILESENKYEERIVLFLDILGFKSLVKDSENNKAVFYKIFEALSKLNNYQDRQGKIPLREITTFSDSIVISYPLDNRFLPRIIYEIRDLVLILLEYNILCRGGIGFGKLYHHGSLVYGPAMVEAYELESYAAKYPRVVIKEADFLKYIKVCSFKNYEHFIMKDDDGIRYINIFNFYYSDTGEMCYESKFLKDKMEEIISKNITNSDNRIREKYEWLLNKFQEGLKIKVCFIPVNKKLNC